MTDPAERLRVAIDRLDDAHDAITRAVQDTENKRLEVHADGVRAEIGRLKTELREQADQYPSDYPDIEGVSEGADG